jgi:hypothetical protein
MSDPGNWESESCGFSSCAEAGLIHLEPTDTIWGQHRGCWQLVCGQVWADVIVLSWQHGHQVLAQGGGREWGWETESHLLFTRALRF